MGTKVKDRMEEALAKGGDKVIEAYSDRAWLRALVAAIPHLGGALDALLSAKADEIRRERIEYLFDKLFQATAMLDEDKVDYLFLDSEEFFDIFVKTLEAASKTRQRDKIDFYAKILCNSAIAGLRDSNDPESYLEILLSLSVPELRLLKLIWAQQRVPPPSGQGELYKYAIDCGWEKISDGYLGVGKEELPFLINRLEGKGLIMGFAGGWGVGSDPSAGRVITSTGRKMLEYLEQR